MAENKTQKNDGNVEAFLNAVEHDKRRIDALALLKVFKELTQEEPKMWGTSIVGFGQYHYKYDSGREGDFFITGFSPRKTSLTLYIMNGFDRYDELMAQLGKHKTGKSCLYIKKLEDIDMEVLKMLIQESVKYMKNKYY